MYKTIQLKSLTLINWKGEQNRTIEFGEITTIAGCNGLGKTRTRDSFIWLLTGKDGEGRDNYEIKTTKNGKVLHEVDCVVEGVFDINGDELKIKRVLSEDWAKARGAAERVFKGNNTKCYWNDAPISVGEYSKRVNETFCNAAAFQLITNPDFFPSMPWKEQREILFQMAGVPSNEDVVIHDPSRFADLLKVIDKKPIADYKAELASQYKHLKDQLAEIQPRIDQTSLMKPAPENWEELVAEANEITRKSAEVVKAITDANAASDRIAEQREAITREIYALQDKANAIYAKVRQEATQAAEMANNAERERVAKANQQRTELGYKVDALINEQRMLNNLVEDIQRIIDDAEVSKIRHSAKRVDIGKEWSRVNAQQYNGETTCKYCGQELPADKIAEARESWMRAHNDEIARITEEGMAEKVTIDALTKKIEEEKEHIENVKSKLKLVNKELEAKSYEYSQMESERPNLIQPVCPNYEDITECAEIDKKVVELKEQVNTMTAAPTDESLGLKKELEALRNRDAEITKLLAKREQIDRCNKAIEQLELHGKQITQQMADIEQKQYILSDFTKARVELCEAKINNLFSIVTFQLFDHTIDGNEYECCKMLVNGVPYGTTNDASKINGGLDVINALTKHLHISAPIFIDRAESVNQPLLPDSCQCVLLRVTTDKELTITTNN